MSAGRAGWGVRAALVLAAVLAPAPASSTQDDVDILAQALKDGAWNERIRAANQLGSMSDPEAVPALRQALNDPDWQVRFAAAHWLGRRGETAKRALEARLASETCPLVRLTLAHWLARVGSEPGPRPGAEAPGRLGDCESWFWPVSPEYLQGRGRKSTTMVATPPDANGCVYVRFSQAGKTSCPAGTVVKGVGSSPGHTDFLRDTPAHSGVALCCPAGRDLGAAVGEAPAAQEAECRLVPVECPTGWVEMAPEPEKKGFFSHDDQTTERSKRLRDGDLIWVNCCRVPQAPKPEPEPAKPSWSEPDARSRIAGLPVVTIEVDGDEQGAGEGAAGEEEPPPEPRPGSRPRPAEARPEMQEVRLVKSGQKEAAGAGSPAAPAPVDSLVEVLKKGGPEERARSALALGMLGSQADPAVSHLITALKDSNPRVRACAALALGKVTQGSDRAVAFLRALLSDPHSGVRLSAAQSLGRVGTPAAQKAFSSAMREDAARFIKSGGSAGKEEE